MKGTSISSILSLCNAPYYLKNFMYGWITIGMGYPSKKKKKYQS